MLLRYFFLTLVMTVVSWTYMCPEPYVCKCQETTFNCTCDSRQNVTVTSIFDYEIRHVLIDGCGTVHIPMGSMFYLNLDSIVFNDLERLLIDPFALAGLQTVEVLSVSNVQHMEVGSRSFSGLNNISTVSISNVSWENVWTESFGGVSSTENFIITDSKFETVESLAFILQNITKFSAKNCDFGRVENMSLLVRGSEEVSFENCSFREISSTAFSVSFVENLIFQKCSFDAIAYSAIFTKHLGTFGMIGCSVNVLATYAFKNIEGWRRIHFSNNIVNLAEENSLYLNAEDGDQEGTEIIISGNKFTCDCNLTWLWQNERDVYKSIIDSSFCLGSSGKLRISSVASRINAESRCSLFNETFSQGSENKTTYEYLTSVSSTLSKQCWDFFIVAFCYAALIWRY